MGGGGGGEPPYMMYSALHSQKAVYAYLWSEQI